MKRFRCFVCGHLVLLKDTCISRGLCCSRCYLLIEELPEQAQRILSFIFRRLEALEREIHGRIVGGETAGGKAQARRRHAK